MTVRRICSLVPRLLVVGFTLCFGLVSGGRAGAAEFRLSDKVLVQYDVFGVPHITASSDADLLFAQGLVTARDRLWQMDYSRRLVSGRLAEILGDSMIEQDFEVRRIGLFRASAATYESLDDGMKKLLAAYAAGVNHYISTHRHELPREFKDLGYVPEAWHPMDSVTIPMACALSWFIYRRGFLPSIGSDPFSKITSVPSLTTAGTP